ATRSLGWHGGGDMGRPSLPCDQIAMSSRLVLPQHFTGATYFGDCRALPRIFSAISRTLILGFGSGLPAENASRSQMRVSCMKDPPLPGREATLPSFTVSETRYGCLPAVCQGRCCRWPSYCTSSRQAGPSGGSAGTRRLAPGGGAFWPEF